MLILTHLIDFMPTKGGEIVPFKFKKHWILIV